MPPVPIADDTFCIGILGDFLGEDWGGSSVSEAAWIPRRATPDTVLTLTGLKPRIRVGAGGKAEEIEFSSLENFDPGDLFRHLALFGPVREAREAAKEGRPVSSPPSGGGPPFLGDREQGPDSDGFDGGEGSAGQGLDLGGGGLLDAILDHTQPSPPSDPGRARSEPGTKEELEAFVREVVQPHLIKADYDLPARLAAVDEGASALMSGLLHSEAFQRVEAIWRSVVALLSRIDTTGKVRVYLVHLPKSGLARDLSKVDDLSRSSLHHLLSEPDLGVAGRRWAVVVGAYDFGTASDDIRMLERVAGVARIADVPWLSSFQPGAPGEHDRKGDLEAAITDLPEEWERFRESPEAAWVGLIHPRFLVREPYGSARRHSKVFDFKEAVEKRSDYLWGNGAFLSAALLAQGFAAGEWRFRPENHLDLGGMSLSGSAVESGETPTSVEARLSPTSARDLMGAGLIPLLGFPERASIRLGGFHSVATSGAPIQGWWKS